MQEGVVGVLPQRDIYIALATSRPVLKHLCVSLKEQLTSELHACALADPGVWKCRLTTRRESPLLERFRGKRGPSQNTEARESATRVTIACNSHADGVRITWPTTCRRRLTAHPFLVHTDTLSNRTNNSALNNYNEVTYPCLTLLCMSDQQHFTTVVTTVAGQLPPRTEASAEEFRSECLSLKEEHYGRTCLSGGVIKF
ncbi:hypothetical protein EVAR_28077_1 [Eumeta japonica]|uniref:Uncharacterized protein n=1 Tax=Eumeta variegata TaxID=151549 RepID=A0A4C1WC09_EUMVA|nr:hypothetical protein EVAR_28077_1 [Eumeta japonica]